MVVANYGNTRSEADCLTDFNYHFKSCIIYTIKQYDILKQKKVFSLTILKPQFERLQTGLKSKASKFKYKTIYLSF